MLLTILLIVIATIILNAVIRFSINYLLLLRGKYYSWLVIMAIIGISSVCLSTLFERGVDVFSTSIVLSILINIPRTAKNESDKQALKSVVDNLFMAATNRKNGKRLYVIGLWVYGLSALLAWMYFYADVS